jgi:hypothetical protein
MLRLLQQVGKDPVRQESDILGKEAEDDPVEKPGGGFRIVMSCAEAS